MQSWELIVSPTESYLYAGIAPQDPEAKYVEVVPKLHLVQALLQLERIKAILSCGVGSVSEILALCEKGLQGFDRVFVGQANYDGIPWRDASEWKVGHWYPLPIGSNWTGEEENMLYTIEGWDIFYQDPDAKEDILPVGTPTTTFMEACKACEFHNKEPLPWKK